MSEFFIRGENGSPHQVLIYDVIGMSYWADTVTAKAIVLAMAGIDPNDEILVRISSRGGNHDDGTAIYNVLANHAGKVSFKIEGYACSMASVICAAGAPGMVASYETALFMLHRASASVWGNANDMLEAATALEAADNSIATAYARKTGKKVDDVLAFMDEQRDTWLTPEQAKAFGLIDEIIVPSKFVALLDKSAATALAADEGAAILEGVALPPKIKAALAGVSGAVAVRVDGDKISAITAGEKTSPVHPPKAPDPVAGPVPSAADVLKADRQRVADIMAQAKAAGIDGDDIVQDWINDGVSVEAAGRFILAIKRSSQSANHVQSNASIDPQKPESSAVVAKGWGDAYKSVSKR